MVYCLLLGAYEEERDGVNKDCQFSRNGLAATAGDGCNDGSIPRDPAGSGLPDPPPRYLMLHIRPLGICSRFADRDLSVFVIEGLAPAADFFGASGPRPDQAVDRLPSPIGDRSRIFPRNDPRLNDEERFTLTAAQRQHGRLFRNRRSRGSRAWRRKPTPPPRSACSSSACRPPSSAPAPGICPYSSAALSQYPPADPRRRFRRRRRHLLGRGRSPSRRS